MAKLKTKKSKVTFAEGLTGILEAHKLYLEPEVLEPLLKDFEIYYNETFKPDNKTPFWSNLVSQYLAFYLNLTGEKAAFNPIQAIALKKLSKLLMERYLASHKDGVWDLETCLRQHQIFYEAVCTLEFYRRAFNVALCYNSFDTITAQLSARRKKEEEEKKKVFG